MTIGGGLAAALSATCLVLAASGILVLPGWRHPDHSALADAGWHRSLRSWEGIRLAFVLLIVAAGAQVGVPWLALAPFAALVPSLMARERAGVKRDQARRDVTRALAATHATLRSGAPLVEALRQGRDAAGAALARRPFDRALREFTLGAPLDEALRAASALETDERTRVALATLALGVGERLSVERIAALVGAVAERSTFDDRLDEEVRARSSGAQTQVRLLAVVVPGLAGYLALTMPGIAETLGGPLGRELLLPAALALETAGIFLSRRFVAEALR